MFSCVAPGDSKYTGFKPFSLAKFTLMRVAFGHVTYLRMGERENGELLFLAEGEPPHRLRA